MHDPWWDNGWSRAAYFTGDMAHHALTDDLYYLAFARAWAEGHGWGLQGGCATANADNQAAGQTYIALYKLEAGPDPAMLDCLITSVTGSHADDWWWIDALYMAMPVYAELGVLFPQVKTERDREIEEIGRLTLDQRTIDLPISNLEQTKQMLSSRPPFSASSDEFDYHAAMYDRYDQTRTVRGLYDADAGLWYRDERYVYPAAQTPNGEKIFWSRGNGWVFAAHARVLDILPADDLHRAEYLDVFRAMAAALKAAQRDDGFWNVSLADPQDYPGPESSGTAFFTYGLAWGVNHGVLARADYEATIAKGWRALAETAVHADGTLGYVQGVGEAPTSSQPVTYESTADFGVGAFLLAGSEVFKLATGPSPAPAENVLLSRPARCSSEPQPENPCGNALDGRLDGRWSAASFPQSLEVELDGRYVIDRVRLYPYESRAYNYVVEVRASPQAPYARVVDRSANPEPGPVFEDDGLGVRASAIRVTVTGATGYAGEWVSVLEVEAFGREIGEGGFYQYLPMGFLTINGEQ